MKNKTERFSVAGSHIIDSEDQNWMPQFDSYRMAHSVCEFMNKEDLKIKTMPYGFHKIFWRFFWNSNFSVGVNESYSYGEWVYTKFFFGLHFLTGKINLNR